MPNAHDFDYNTLATVDLNSGELTKTGYHFSNWNTENTGEGTSYIVGQTFTITEDITLFAIFEVNTYTITLDVNGGDELTENTLQINYAEIIPNLAEPTRLSHIFLGWYSGETKINQNEDAYMFTENLTFTAHWIRTYLITFDFGNGTPIESLNEVEGTNITLPTPSRTGYSFVNWSDGIATYNAGESFSTSASDVSFEAIWSANSYTITYNLFDGTNDTSNLASYTIEDDNFALLDATKLGYTFEDWFTTDNFEEGTTIETIDTSTLQNYVLYAKYTIIIYTISYDLNDGPENTENKTSYNVETSTFEILGLEDITGYYFAGWYSDEELTTLADTTIEQGSTGNLVFYAKYELKVPTINFVVNGGNIIDPISQDYGTSLTLPIPVKEGYDFLGWFDNVNLLGQPVTFTTMPESTTLYANFAVKEVKISFVVNGGVVVVDIVGDYNSVLTLPTPLRAGYTFKGWYLDEEFTTPANELTSMPSEDTVLYALWEKSADNTIMTYALVGFAGLVCLIFIVYFISKPKKNKAKQKTSTKNPNKAKNLNEKIDPNEEKNPDQTDDPNK